MRLAPNLSPGDTSWIYSIPTLWDLTQSGLFPSKLKEFSFSSSMLWEAMSKLN